MTHEVVVVGAGIGGLTVAALLAARGVDVCLLERESGPGGCVAPFEKFGYTFDPGAGLYPLWQKGEIHDQIFSQLPVSPPEVSLRDPGYVVRLPDQSDIPISANREQFEDALRTIFPECVDRAIGFYRESTLISDVLRRALLRVPDLHSASSLRKTYALLPDFLRAARIVKARNDSTAAHLGGTSFRFRRFVDAQLQLLAQAPSDECSFLYSTLALTIPREGLFSIRGGAPALAARLAESLKASGGKIRFDTPVLRLSYDASGRAVGVDLLSGETVGASRAIVSNLTVWDTYGKLIGLNRTPLPIRKRLTTLRSWGVYLLYLGLDAAAASRIPSTHILTVTDWQEQQSYNPETDQLMLSTSPEWDPRAPEGRRAATVLTFSDVEEWFTFQADEQQHEEKDRSALETWWERLYKSIPELGAGVELIETATPRTFYDLTRRKLGMVGAVRDSTQTFGPNWWDWRTFLPNVFLTGDTVFPGGGLAGVSHAALALANRLTKQDHTLQLAPNNAKTRVPGAA
ncbi:MAG: phytoene desaturase family protein [Pyrinomonadaceae bacterium]